MMKDKRECRVDTICTALVYVRNIFLQTHTIGVYADAGLVVITFQELIETWLHFLSQPLKDIGTEARISVVT